MSLVLSSFSEIANHVLEMYSGSNPLVYLMDNVSMVLSSEEGIHQGDRLGPVLFSLGIHNILATIQCKFQGIVVLAHLDDVFLVGSSLDVLDAFASLKQEFGNVGLQIQDKKCELYCPLPSAVPDLLSTDIAISNTRITILGIPISSHDFISNVCIDVANSANVFCQQLPDLNEPQGAMLLLRHCHANQLNHLARGVCPDSLQPAATIHDRLTKKCFTTLIGTRDLTARQWEQATLPYVFVGSE